MKEMRWQAGYPDSRHPFFPETNRHIKTQTVCYLRSNATYFIWRHRTCAPICDLVQ